MGGEFDILNELNMIGIAEGKQRDEEGRGVLN